MGDSVWNLVAVAQSPEVARLLNATFKTGDCKIELVKDEKEAVQRLQEGTWDGLILETNLEHSDFSSCAWMRQHWQGPFVLLVNREASSSIVKAYELGIDAHVVTPFDHRELLARTCAILRRGRPLKRSPNGHK